MQAIRPRFAFIAVVIVAAWGAACSSEQTARTAAPQAPGSEPALSAFEIVVPGTTVTLALVPVPRGTLDVADPARPGPDHVIEIPAFWIASTETTWDMYDAFVFAQDRAETERDPPDAWARPSKPYILMDRGFGHSGYPAISVSCKGATEFCKWLSAKTGRHFRLPTEFEWERACRAGDRDAHALDDRAWFADNSTVDGRRATHPVARKQPDALGLYDMHGNAAEWTTSATGTGVARGGSFKDSAGNVGATSRMPDDKSLNKTDPQLPRSVWWLADGGFIGFRVACEPDPVR